MGLFDSVLNLMKTGDNKAAPAELPGRNDLCWCGSGRKYKKCHLSDDEKKSAPSCSLSCGPG